MISFLVSVLLLKLLFSLFLLVKGLVILSKISDFKIPLFLLFLVEISFLPTFIFSILLNILFPCFLFYSDKRFAEEKDSRKILVCK